MSADVSSEQSKHGNMEDVLDIPWFQKMSGPVDFVRYPLALIDQLLFKSF